MSRLDHHFVMPPDPGSAGTLDEVADKLRLLKIWAGDPSYDTIKGRINAAWKMAGLPGGELAKKTTVADCFKAGRRRVNTDLVIAVVQALHPDVGYVTQWRQMLRVVGSEARAAAQVQVQDTLPQELTGFTGRHAELERLRQALRPAEPDGGTAAISTIIGMAGVGKTQLAIRAGHLFVRDKLFDRVLVVNLRGFHPDPAQPPADPAAVLEAFLRLLGVPGQQIPHGLPARSTMYRDRLAGTRTLVLLDNAAEVEQVRPLLPATAGCAAMITSRRRLTALQPATPLTLEAFTSHEASTMLTRAVPDVPVGSDPQAVARIARRCGYLPLALGLLAGHVRGTAGWTLTDHADRLDERHRDRRLDTGVQIAIDVSYRHLPAAHQRLLRLAALHPGQDIDAYAAAALEGTDVATARISLRRLERDHLLQLAIPGRYTFHDLIRAYATERGADEDPPPNRRAAQTRLFDYYLAGAAASMDALYPAEAAQRPGIAPPGTPMPDLADPDVALAWLDAERPALLAVAAYAAAHGWQSHTTALSVTVYRYLDTGHTTDALSLHGYAHRAACHTGDLTGQAHALNGLGTANLRLGRYDPAAEHLRHALRLFRQLDDPASQARVLGSLGNIEKRLGRYASAIDHHRQALAMFRRAGDRAGEARALRNRGVVEGRLGRFRAAVDHLQQALSLCRLIGDQTGEFDALSGLGEVETRMGNYRRAVDHYEPALVLCRQLGDRDGEAAMLDELGTVCTRLGRPAEAVDHHQRALAYYRETGDRDGEAWALNGLGEAASEAAEVLAHHTAAHRVAADIGSRDQQARAHAGLGHAHQVMHRPGQARQHYQQALSIYTDLGMPEAADIRSRLAAVEEPPVRR